MSYENKHFHLRKRPKELLDCFVAKTAKSLEQMDSDPSFLIEMNAFLTPNTCIKYVAVRATFCEAQYEISQGLLPWVS